MSFTEKSTSEEVANQFADQISGKIVLITGCSWGSIGAEIALISAKYGAEQVIICGRRKEAVEETKSKIIEQVPSAKIITSVFDLGSLKSIREAAKEINLIVDIKAIDVLINSAGIMACPYSTTDDGFESQFGANHLGHFLFTNLILDKIFAAKNPRIVNVSSNGHHFSPIRFDDIGFANGANYVPFQAYGQSKTANILFSRELHERYNKSKGLVSFSVHPGSVTTNLGRHMDIAQFIANPDPDYKGDIIFDGEILKNTFFKSVSQGAAPVLNVSFNPLIEDLSGNYADEYVVDESTGNPFAKSLTDAEKLWKLSELLVGESF